MFSKTCEYAIKIMIYIATRRARSRRVGLDEITEAIGSPKAFTAKILQQLTKAGLLDSVRGRTGGFILPPDKKIVLGDIVRATDGEKLLKGCVLGFNACSETHPCPIHHKYKEVRKCMSDSLMSISMIELKRVMDGKEAYLLSS